MKPPAAPRQPRRPAATPGRTRTATVPPVRPPADGRSPAASVRTRGTVARPAERSTWSVAGTVSTGLAARLAERDAAARRLLLRRAAIAAGVLALLAGIAWVLLASPLLALDGEKVTVQISGSTVATENVLAAVEPELGTPLLRVSTADVAGRLAELPAVKDAQVSRTWPRGLAVTVVAREPVAAAASPEGWVLVDAEGVRIATVTEVPAGLPEVTVPLETSEETAPAVAAVLTVLGSLPEDLIGQIAQAGATGSAQVTLVLHDGATVRWGSAEENALKLEVLRVLRQQPASTYDVSVPRTPTTS